jgi:hypothetical protein
MSKSRLHIPKGLETALADKPKLRKAMDTYIMLMYIMPDQACFKKTRQVMESVADKCGISYDTLTRRMKLLAEHDISYVYADQWYIRGWDRVIDYFKLSGKNFYRIKYTGRKVEYLLRWLSPQPIVQTMKDCYKYYMDKTAGLKENMIEVTGSASAADVLKLQLSEFIHERTEYQYLWDKIHADFNLSTHSLRELWGMTSKGGVKYWKDKFEKMGLWAVKKRHVVLSGHKTEKSRKTTLGTVVYAHEIIRLKDNSYIYGRIKSQLGSKITIDTQAYCDMTIDADSIAEIIVCKRPVLVMPDEIRFLNANHTLIANAL